VTENQLVPKTAGVSLIEIYNKRSRIIDEVNEYAPWLKLYREVTYPYLDNLFSRGSLLLDAGGGTGIFARSLSAEGRRIVVVDVNATMLSRVQVSHSNFLRCVQGDITDLSMFRSNSFDGIFCTQMLNLVENRPAAFAEFYRVLRTGGVLFCDIDGVFRWAVVEMISKRLGNAVAIVNGKDDASEIIGSNYYFISAANFKEEIKMAGFKKIQLRGIQHFSPLLHAWGDSESFLKGHHGLDLNLLRQLEQAAESYDLGYDSAGWIQVTALK